MESADTPGPAAAPGLEPSLVTRDRPIFDAFPSLQLPFVALGDFPTPVEPLDRLARALDSRSVAFVKRDDLSSRIYGGNKVRTLEVLFAQALEEGATHIYSTGAFGTNHGTAMLLHAPRVGLQPGLVLWPQDISTAARENFEVLVGTDVGRRPSPMLLPHWSALPFGMAWAEHVHQRRGERPFVMVPGGATPRGAIGYVSAAFELAEQIERGDLPAPRRIVIAVGSTCTTAGLLLGTHLCAARGFGWRYPPTIHAVRVTPWPVTAHSRIVSLAVRTGERLAELTRDPSAAVSRARLGATLAVDGSQLGPGYGLATDAGRRAIVAFREAAGFELDTTYSAKGAAGLVARMRMDDPGPMLFWSTKSTAPLPPSVAAADARAPRARRWLERASAS
ncbi:MAG: pyridoxal-phosphate dependent enzyme [Deltaproteobacteria bacterium]|nr:pyridoxal-phosphate dependent enzyme [Deltaproteobacteria bacterium]